MSLLDEYLNPTEEKPQARAPVATAQATLPPFERTIAKEEYKAFSAPTEDRQTRLIIYAKKGGYMMPKYDVSYDVFMNPDGTQLVLVFPHHAVIMEGRHLLEVAGKLRNDAVEWVRDFDHRIHLPVTDDRCLITKIETRLRKSEFERDSFSNPAQS